MQKLTFKDIKEEIRKVNPEFVEIVESVKGAQNCGVYLAEYRYGDYIVKAGGFNVPIAGELKDLRECDDKLKTDLGYNFMTNPISMVLEKSIELYISLVSAVISFTIYQPGDFFGFSSIVSLNNPKVRVPSAVNSWTMTAGMRNVAILASISDESGLNALMREFDFICTKPDGLLQHWQVIKGVGYQDSNWVCKMLYFDIEWFKNLDNKNWGPIKIYFYDQFNAAMQFYTNYLPWNISFSLAQKKRNILATTSVNETIKYLFGIASGFLIGHEVARNEESLPLEFIQRAMGNVYGLPGGAPILMTPSLFQTQPVYYSLQYPLQASAIKLDPSRSIIQRHDDLYHTLSRYKQSFLLDTEYHAQDTPLIQAAKTVNFDFYHRNSKRYEYMHDSEALAESKDFRQVLKTLKSEFPRGCRQIIHHIIMALNCTAARNELAFFA